MTDTEEGTRTDFEADAETAQLTGEQQNAAETETDPAPPLETTEQTAQDEVGDIQEEHTEEEHAAEEEHIEEEHAAEDEGHIEEEEHVEEEKAGESGETQEPAAEETGEAMESGNQENCEEEPTEDKLAAETDEGSLTEHDPKEQQLADTLDYLSCHEQSAARLGAELLNLQTAANHMSGVLGDVDDAFRQYASEMDSTISDERLMALRKATSTATTLTQNMQKVFLDLSMTLGRAVCEPVNELVQQTVPYARHAAFIHRKDAGVTSGAEEEFDAEVVNAAPSVVMHDESARATAAEGGESLLDRALNISVEAFNTACSTPQQVVLSLASAMDKLCNECLAYTREARKALQPSYSPEEESNKAAGTYEDTDGDQTGTPHGERASEASSDEDELELRPDVACNALVDMEDEYYKTLSLLHSVNDDLLSDRIEGLSLAPGQTQYLFSNTSDLFHADEAFVKALHEALKETYYPTAITALYASNFAKLERMYLHYTESVPLFEAAYDEAKDNKAFVTAVFYKIKGTAFDKEAITDFKELFAVPGKYIGLQKGVLSALLREISTDDRTYHELSRLVTQYTMLQAKIEQVKSRDSDVRKLVQLQKRFPLERIVQRGRKFLSSTILGVSGVAPAQVKDAVEADQNAALVLPAVSKFKKKGKWAESGLSLGCEYRCALFNDEIIFAPNRERTKKEIENNVFPPLKVTQKWSVLSLIPRRAPLLKNGGAPFFLHTPDGLYTLEIIRQDDGKTSAAQQCDNWMMKLEGAIAQRHSTRVFGNHLSVLAQRKGDLIGGVPAFIAQAADFIEQEGLDEEGVFRQSAGAAAMADLITEIDSGSVPNYAETHSAANIIKKWLRDLPDRLLVDSLCDKWADAGEDPAKLRAVLMEMPRCNRATVAKLMHLFHAVARHADTNLMTPNNLGIVVGVNMLPSSKVGAECFEAMLRHYDEIFGGTGVLTPFQSPTVGRRSHGHKSSDPLDRKSRHKHHRSSRLKISESGRRNSSTHE